MISTLYFNEKTIRKVEKKETASSQTEEIYCCISFCLIIPITWLEIWNFYMFFGSAIGLRFPCKWMSFRGCFCLIFCIWWSGLSMLLVTCNLLAFCKSNLWNCQKFWGKQWCFSCWNKSTFKLSLNRSD